jgi:hypothetical protein
LERSVAGTSSDPEQTQIVFAAAITCTAKEWLIHWKPTKCRGTVRSTVRPSYDIESENEWIYSMNQERINHRPPHSMAGFDLFGMGRTWWMVTQKFKDPLAIKQGCIG